MIVNQAQVRKVKEKLARRGKGREIISELKQMLEIKQALLSRADMGLCCAQGCRLSDILAQEVILLEETLLVAENRDRGKAETILGDYLDFLESNYYEDGDNIYCRL